MAPVDSLLDIFLISLKYGFNRSVLAIAHPSAKTELNGHFLGFRSKKDPLHSTTNFYKSAYMFRHGNISL